MIDGSGLTIEGLTVAYRGATALHEVALTVRPGQILALAGPNGAGKSSLVRAVVGLAPVAAGAIAWNGRPVAGLAPEERARVVGWMPQEEPVGDNVSLRDYVLFGRYPHAPRFVPESAGDREVADRIVAEFGFADRSDAGVQELSGGERQRLRLGRVLAQETPLLLLDEPTAHLDMGHQLELLGRVRRLAHDEGRAVVAALHDLNLAARFADRVVVLHKGRVAADGPATSVLSAALLRDVWGVVADLRRDPRSGLPYLIPRLPTDAGPVGGATPLRRVHVVGGGGSAERVLRALVAEGHRVTLGVVALFDTDSQTAEELGVPAVLEVPFAPIGEEARARNRAFLQEAEAVVVAPFPVAWGNLPLLDDVLAVADRTPTYLLGPSASEPGDFTGGDGSRKRAALAEKSSRVADEAELLRALAASPRHG